MKPSDQRIKQNVTDVDTSTSLKTINQIKLHDYELKTKLPNTDNKERGVLAQELRDILPMAVKKLDQVTFENGTTVQNILVVNERLLLYENVGATQELSKIVGKNNESVDKLGTRIEKLEDETTSLVNGPRASVVNSLVDYVTDDQFQQEFDDGSTLCYCSMFGLGPAWTLWVFGFFFPLFWMGGIAYLMSPIVVRRRAGFANLFSFTFFLIFLTVGLLVADAQISEILFIVYASVVFVIFLVITFVVAKDNQQRRRSRADMREKLKEKYLAQQHPRVFTIVHNPKGLSKGEDRMSFINLNV